MADPDMHALAKDHALRAHDLLEEVEATLPGASGPVSPAMAHRVALATAHARTSTALATLALPFVAAEGS